MLETEKYLFIGSAAIEAIAAGLGMTGIVSPVWGGLIAGSGLAVLIFALFRVFRRRSAKEHDRQQVTISVRGKQYLNQLKGRTIEANERVEILLSEARRYTPSDYIESYYKNDDHHQQLAEHYKDETEAVLMQLLVLPTNPRFEELLEADQPLKAARIDMNRLSTRIGDQILDERINAYFRGVSEIGAGWLASQLVDQYGKGGTLDVRFKGQQANMVRKDAIRKLRWQIISRIEQLLQSGDIKE